MVPLPARGVPAPTLRLRFRPWREHDLALATQLWGDARVMRLVGGALDGAGVAARLAREQESQETRGLSYWPIFALGSNAFVGACGLRPYDDDETRGGRDAELGFHLVPEAWGRGLAVEAAASAIEHGFGVLALARIFAGHHPDNAASARVLERLGMQPSHEALYPPTGKLHPWRVLERAPAPDGETR